MGPTASNPSGGVLATASKLVLNQYTSDRQRFLLAIASTLFGSWAIWRLLSKQNKRSSKHSTVPVVPGALPLLGHTLKITPDPLAFIQKCRKEHGPAFRINLSNQELYVLTGRLIPELFSFSRKVVNFSDGVELLLPVNRVIRLSYNHKHEEEVISPRDKSPIVFPVKQNFKPQNIHVFSDRIQKAFKEALHDHLKLSPGERKQVNTWDFLANSISRISCLCFAGSQVGTDKDLVSAMASFTQSIGKAAAPLLILPTWLGDMLVRRFFSVERQLDIAMGLIIPHLTKIRSEEIPDDEPTFISMALNLPKSDGLYRSPADAVYYFKDVALASIHTTTHFTTFSLHELACRPKLVQELRDLISQLHERTPETVSEIKLLDSFFREVLRYDIDNLTLFHLARQDIVLSTGQLIPKNSVIAVASEDAHKDPNLYEYSGAPLDQFDPYRFVNVQEDKKSSTVGQDLVSFGLGAHSCPGRYFAVNEIKYVLAELIMRFNFSTPSGRRGQDDFIMGMIKLPPKEDIIFEAI